MLSLSRRASLLGACALALAVPTLARAQSEDPAFARVSAFNAVLLNTMKAGKSLGLSGRESKLRPAIQTYFNLPIMAQFACGASWGKMSEADRESVVSALTRYTVSSYAHNFDSFSGEKFVVDPKVATRGPDKMVRTQIVAPKDSPTSLSYRMREYGGQWKIIDIYYNNISQLTTQRSDFAAALNSGGAPALVAKLDQLSMKLK